MLSFVSLHVFNTRLQYSCTCSCRSMQVVQSSCGWPSRLVGSSCAAQFLPAKPNLRRVRCRALAGQQAAAGNSSTHEAQLQGQITELRACLEEAADMHAAHEAQTVQLQTELSELREKYDRASKDAKTVQNIARAVSEARAVRTSLSSGRGTPSQHSSPYRPSTARTHESGFGGEALPRIAESPSRGSASSAQGMPQAQESALTHANVAAHAGLFSQQSAAEPWATVDDGDSAAAFSHRQRHTIGAIESQVQPLL